MRLIDADALKEKAFGKRGGLIHTEDIDNAPTIEERTDKRTETHACDLICRQAAIDEIRKCRFVVDAIEKIRGLPSAQPEPIKINIEDFDKEDWERLKKEWGNTPITVLPAQPEIICCKDCKYFETAGNLLDGLCRRHRIPTTMYSTGFCSMAERRTDE